jgi:hypothetical protein
MNFTPSDFSNERLKDFAHGQRLFGANQNRLSPKFSYLYHVFFEISSDIGSMYKSGSDPVKEVGMLVKSVDLPKFDVETKTLNAYNQHVTVQTGIKYNPVSIQFHDDSANVVRNFWEDYMVYYYGDATNSQTTAGAIRENRYKIPDSTVWGFQPKNSKNYLRSVKIYSLSMDKYSLYTLVNPTIDSWTHGSHVAGQSEFIGHTMTLNYEYVQYSDGNIGGGSTVGIGGDIQVDGFGDVHYDKATSMLTYGWARSGGNGRSDVNVYANGDPRVTTDSTVAVPYSERQYGANPRSLSGSTLGSRLRASIARAGQSVINSAIIKAENRIRNVKIGNSTVNSILQPALQNTITQGAAGLSNSIFPSPNK